MNQIATGFLLLVVAGIANSNFATPMKYTRRWAWENTWFAWTIFALLILPSVTTVMTVPGIWQIYQQSGGSILLTVSLYGAGWGVAQVFFGLAVESIGIALTFSIVMGISAAVGSMVPMIRLHPEKLFSHAGYGLMAGVSVMMLGVIVCAVAGSLRERVQASHQDRSKQSYGVGLTLAILCGLGASFVNLALSFGTPIVDLARSFGVTPLHAVNAVWALVMLAGAIPNLGYCIYLMRRNHTSGKMRAGGASHWLLAFLMACLWFGSTILYGSATIRLGSLGTIFGWPLFMSLIVISAGLVGMLTGEWKQSGRKPALLQTGGVALLVTAVFVLTRS